MLRNPLRLGLGMAAVAGAVPEPIVSINSSLPTQIDGRARNCWSLVTIRAARFGVMGRDTTSLHAYGAPKTGHVIAIRANAAHPIPTQIETPDHDELGNTLFTVSNNDVKATQSICERLQVGAAINLLMHQLDHAVMVDFVSIRNACIDHANHDSVTAFITSQGGTLVHRALIRPEGAVLFAEPDRSTLATVSRDMIDAHAAAHQIPDAV